VRDDRRPGKPERLVIIHFPTLAASILELPIPSRLRLVAVDGRAGSGKSTFAAELARSLGAAVLPLDDFLAWDDLTDFWPRLEHEVLQPLGSGRDARYRARDWERDPLGRGLGELRTFPFAPVVVMEGVGASRRTVAERLAYTIWIETRRVLCLERGLARDGEGARARWTSWQILEDGFLANEAVAERADLVVDGEARAKAGEFVCLRQGAPNHPARRRTNWR
jgi:hypothetical protein